MDAATIQVAYRARSDATWRSAFRLTEWVSPILTAALVLAALAIATRRLAGGLVQPLAASDLLLATFGAAVLAIGSRSQRTMHRRSVAVWINQSAVTLSITIFVGALALQGTQTGGVAGAWSIVIVEETWAWGRFLRIRRTYHDQREFAPPLPSLLAGEGPQVKGAPTNISPTSPRPSPVEAGETSLVSSLAASSPPAAPSFFPPPAVSPQSAEMHQQLTRANLADGADRLAGWLQATFEPGERTATIHVAFCPPFAAVPKIAVRQTSGPATRIKPGQILTHGIRLELKLNFASRAAERVLVEFSAESRPSG